MSNLGDTICHEGCRTNYVDGAIQARRAIFLAIRPHGRMAGHAGRSRRVAESKTWLGFRRDKEDPVMRRGPPSVSVGHNCERGVLRGDLDLEADSGGGLRRVVPLGYGHDDLEVVRAGSGEEVEHVDGPGVGVA